MNGPMRTSWPAGLLALWAWLLPPQDARQALRMRRFLTGAASLLVVAGLLVYCRQAGLVGAADFFTVLLLMAVWFGLFYTLLRSGLNLRFADPSLTLPQVLMASAIMYYTAYVADPARATFLIAVLAVFLFGVFRLHTRQLLLLALFDVLLHAAVIFAAQVRSDAAFAAGDLRVEVLQWLVMGSSLLWFALMAGRVVALRAEVAARRRELADATQALARRENDLADVQRLAGLGTWSRDPHDETVIWSDEMFRILGLDPATATARSSGLRSYVHPHDWERYLDHAEHALRGDGDPVIVLRMLHKGGGVRWVELRRDRVAGTDGDVRREYGTMRDTTAAVQSQRRLLMQHQITRILAEAGALGAAITPVLQVICEQQDWVAAACWRLAPDGSHLRCVDSWSLDEPLLQEFSTAHQATPLPVRASGGALMLTAWRSGLPRWVFDVTAHPDYTRRDAAAAAGLRGAFALPVLVQGEVVRMLEFYSPDAREADPAFIELAQSLGNQIGQFIERRGAEAALVTTRAHLDQAVTASGVGFWDSGIESGVDHYSAQCTALLGYGPDQFSGGRAALAALVHADDRDRLKAAWTAGIDTGKTFAVELRLRHRNGEYRWFAAHAQAFYDDSGGAARMAGSLVDIDERKRLDRAKDEFVATVSHELRTPLTAIRGALGLLDGGVAGDLPEDARELVRVSLSGSERLSRLVNDVLNLAKIESGAAPLRAVPLALDPLIDDAITANLPYCNTLGVTLRALGGAPGAVVQADADRIMQVLTNLISNAAKFSPRGADVHVTSTAAGGWLRVSVIDHGCGIPESFRARLFQKFAQADGSDARAQQGSGLGLSISRALVTQMGGVIDFAATPGGGSTFIMELPAHAPGPHPFPPAPAASGAPPTQQHDPLTAPDRP